MNELRKKQVGHIAIAIVTASAIIIGSASAVMTGINNKKFFETGTENPVLGALDRKTSFLTVRCMAEEIPETSSDYQNGYGSFSISYDSSGKRTAAIRFNDGSTYNGEVNTMGPDGSGTVIYKEGDSYTGQYADGVRNGTGTYTWSNGDQYEGNWEDDMMSGDGKYTWADGGSIEGTFDSNEVIDGTYTLEDYDGNYTFHIENGDAYSADITLDNETTYSGDIDNGHLTGSAVIEYSNGDVYDGHVSKAKKSGSGKYTWTSGAVYNGKWKTDRINGKGTYKYASSKQGYKLTGKFKNGKPVGNCKYYRTKKKIYKTIWKNGKCIKVNK